MKLKYYRHATFLMDWGAFRLLVDPMYQKKSRYPPVPSPLRLRWNPLTGFPEEYPTMSEEDVVLITHHHFDHFDSLAAQKLPKNLTVITPENGKKRLRRKNFQNIIPLGPDQTCEVHGIKVQALPVKHAQRLERLLYKPGVGYLLHSASGTIYVSGDTILFSRLCEVLNRQAIDLAILYGGAARIPILGRHTLSAVEIVTLVQNIRPNMALILHLESLNHCTENRRYVQQQIKAAQLSEIVGLPLPGEEYLFDYF